MENENDKYEGAEGQARAQYEGIVEMLAAVDCDYDRLEELREIRKAPRWVAGWNMPGYMPDNPPESFDDDDDAREYLASELESLAGMSEDSAEITLLTSHADLIREGTGDYGETVGKYHYSVTQDGNMLSPDDGEELATLESAAGDCEDQDDARERIQEDPLSVEVRSDWTAPGETLTPSEFMILLCTGGPAVRIRGELDEHLQPSHAWLEYQDWGTPWTQYSQADSATLCSYAANFYFGE